MLAAGCRHCVGCSWYPNVPASPGLAWVGLAQPPSLALACTPCAQSLLLRAHSSSEMEEWISAIMAPLADLVSRVGIGAR